MGESRNLSEDIIHFCILPRLPAKDLIRLQCVSRRWHSLILSDFYFIHLHSQSISSTVVYMNYRKHKDVFREEFVSIDPRLSGILNLPFPIKVNSRIVVASCDGLLCLHWVWRSIFIGNPILRDWRILPDLDFFCKNYGLAVDVEKSGMSFKFVALQNIENVESTTMECLFHILSSRSGKWVVSKYKLDVKLDASEGCWPPIERSAYVNGVLYWLCPAQILWFDTEDERSGFFPLPPDSDVFGHYGEIGRWNGELAHIRVFKGKLEIWSAADRSCWTLRHSICLKRMVQQNSEVFDSLKWKDFARLYAPYGRLTSIYPMPFEGGNVVSFCIGGSIFSYDMETGVAEKKFDSTNRPGWFSYKSSLVPSPWLTSILRNDGF